MPLLSALMISIFGSVLDFFLHYFTKKVALRLAGVSIAVAAFLSLYAFVSASMLALTVSLPPLLSQAFLFLFPSNVNACVSAALGVEIACTGYRLWYENVKAISFVT